MLLTCLHDLLPLPPSIPPSLLRSPFLYILFLKLSLLLHLSSSHVSLQIADLYKRQQQIQNQGDKADPEDYYWSSILQQEIINNGKFNVIVNSFFLFVLLNENKGSF